MRPNPNEKILDEETHPRTTPTESLALGRYLVQNACAECHGTDLSGLSNAADLRVIAAYSEADFRALMRDGVGVGVGKRSLGLMAIVSRLRFSQLSDTERQAIYDYLRSRTRP